MTESEAKLEYESHPDAILQRCRCIHAELSQSKVLQVSIRCNRDDRFTDPFFCALCERREEPDA